MLKKETAKEICRILSEHNLFVSSYYTSNDGSLYLMFHKEVICSDCEFERRDTCITCNGEGIIPTDY